jgi:glutathione S-transferase
MTDLILHHYDFSPFSEKVRLVFGLKGLAWRSVIVPPMMPKPELMPLTGGYRRTPVLQVGADIFCDTRLIVRELERRRPLPTLYPAGTRGESEMVARWAEELLFWPIARYVSGVNAEHMPEGLHADRAAMRGMPTPSVERLKSSARRNRAQLRGQLAWIGDMLADGREWFLASPAPSLADIAVYHCLWFLGALKIDLSGEHAPWPAIGAWMQRVAAIGHGTHSTLAAAEALAIAAQAQPAPTPSSDPGDDGPLPGTRVSVRPEEAFGADAVEGIVTFIDQDEVAIRREDAKVVEVVVHFPRLRYVVKPV